MVFDKPVRPNKVNQRSVSQDPSFSNGPIVPKVAKVPRVPKLNDIQSFLTYLGQEYSGKTALSFSTKTEWAEVPYQDLLPLALSHQEKFQKCGFPPGTHIALLGEPSLEWVLAAFAVWVHGSVLIPLDPKLSLGDLSHVINHSRAELLIFNQKHLAESQFCLEHSENLIEVLPLEKFSLEASQAANYAPAVTRVDPETTALICYTSGTMSKPKGVVVALRTLLFQPVSLQAYDMIRKKDVVYNMLPLNHLFALNAGVLSCLWAGAEVVIASSLDIGEMLGQIRARKVTKMMTVPLFLEMFKTGVRSKVSAQGFKTSKAFSRALKLSHMTKLKRLRRKIFSKVTSAFGKDFLFFICGGAPIQPKTERFFRLLGIPAYAGYGLTETGPVIACNSVQRHRAGSVGQIAKGVECKIIDQEIWTKGPHIFKGYFQDRVQTDEILDQEGWLKTGDLGMLDSQGYLFITGRKKSMIVLQSGKKILAEEIEALLKTSSKIGDSIALGIDIKNQGERVAVLVTPSLKLTQQTELEHAEIEKILVAEVKEVLKDLTAYKKPSFIKVYFGDLPKTGLQKVKRGEALILLKQLLNLALD